MYKNKICGVYKILNKTTGKFYIGSSNNVKRRWKEHINDLNKNKSHSIYLQRAWNKYGEDNFTFEILEECKIENQLEKEQIYLDKLKPWKRKIGYNIEEYARGGSKCGNKNHFYGKHHSEETKKQLSQKHKGKFLTYNHKQSLRENSPNKKKIICLTTEIIYDSIMDAYRQTNISAQNIIRNCKGYAISAGKDEFGNKLIWMYYDQYITNDKEVNKRKSLEFINGKEGKIKISKVNSTKIICLTTQETFKRMLDASKKYKVSYSNISNCCRHKQQTAGKHPETGEKLKWMYYEDYIKQQNQENLIKIS